MKYADEPPLNDQDRRAIEEIRRRLDRELGPPWPDPKETAAVSATDHDLTAPSIPIEPRRAGKGLRLALGAGAVTLAAAVIGAFLSFADLIGPSARSPVSAPRGDAIPTAPSNAPVSAQQSDGTSVEATAESPRRGVPIAKHSPTRERLREPGGRQPRAGRMESSPSGRGASEAAHRRLDPAPVTRDRTATPVGQHAVRSAPLTSIQAP